ARRRKATPAGAGRPRSCQALAQLAQVAPGVEAPIVAVAEVELDAADAGDFQALDSDLGVDQRQQTALPRLSTGRAGAGLAQRQTAQAAAPAIRPEHFEHLLRLAQANFLGRFDGHGVSCLLSRASGGGG